MARHSGISQRGLGVRATKIKVENEVGEFAEAETKKKEIDCLKCGNKFLTILYKAGGMWKKMYWLCTTCKSTNKNDSSSEHVYHVHRD